MDWVYDDLKLYYYGRFAGMKIKDDLKPLKKGNMLYTTQEIQDKFSIAEEDMVKFIIKEHLKIPKSGMIPEKVYQKFLDFYEPKEDEFIKLNGSIKGLEVYKSEDNRISIYQDDAI